MEEGVVSSGGALVDIAKQGGKNGEIEKEKGTLKDGWGKGQPRKERVEKAVKALEAEVREQSMRDREASV